MKTILIAMSLLATVGCANMHEVQQVDMVIAKVVRIDTVFRGPDSRKAVTWKDQDEIQYLTYVSLDNDVYKIGSIMYVMRKR